MCNVNNAKKQSGTWFKGTSLKPLVLHFSDEVKPAHRVHVELKLLYSLYY